MKIKAAIFDVDGTLVDSLFLWDVLWKAFGKKYLNDESFSPSQEDDKKVRTLPLKDAMELIHKNYSIGESGAELLGFANQMMIEFYSNSVKLKSGVREFLEHLKDGGAKMCIASATAPELLSVAMKHCDIEKYFLKVFSCGAIGKGKDKPDIFLMAADYLKVAPEDIWVFEDSLVAIETATEIGMKTVAIYDKYNFGQDRMKEIATEYISESESLLKLIK